MTFTLFLKEYTETRIMLPVLILFLLCTAPLWAVSDYNVRDYGAAGDKQQLDTSAIQSAIDACHEAGGGRVVLPPGDYLSGSLQLRSHVTFWLENGATLWASTEPKDYASDRGHFLTAQDQEHIVIAGSGCIHGQGTKDLRRKPPIKEPMPEFRTRILLFENCRNITIRDITFLYSDSWTLHLKLCDTVMIDGITIHNNYFRTNSDGIDPDSCRNVHISNCHIVGGDDCIVLKTTTDEPCENIVVTNCTLETIATALKLGTESHGDFRNVHFSNCTIRNTPVGIGFFAKDGAVMERISFSNITIENADPQVIAYAQDYVTPIFMDIEKRHQDSKVGAIRDVSFSDIFIDTCSSIVVQGMPESPIQNLSMRNIAIRVNDAMDFSERKKKVGGSRTLGNQRDTIFVRKPAYAVFGYVDGLRIDNLNVFIPQDVFKEYPRSAVLVSEAQNGSLDHIFREIPSKDIATAELENCRDMAVTDISAGGKGNLNVSLKGTETGNIRSDDIPADNR